MNFFKKYALKKYVQHNIQFVYAAIICLIAITLCICALAIDKLTIFPNLDDDYCGWQKETVFDQKYSDKCSSGNDYCDAETAGKYWLGSGITGIILGVISIGFIAVYKYLSFLIYGLSSGAFMAAVIYWTKDNNFCWGDTLDTKYEMGPSPILMICAAVVQFFNLCVAFRIPPQLRKKK